MSTQPPPLPWNREISVDIRQISRWRWAARITYGLCTVGSSGGPYAWSYDRCCRKAMRIVRKLERDRARTEATRHVIYTSETTS